MKKIFETITAETI
jgi:hypothetical protein